MDESTEKNLHNLLGTKAGIPGFKIRDESVRIEDYLYSK